MDKKKPKIKIKKKTPTTVIPQEQNTKRKIKISSNKKTPEVSKSNPKSKSRKGILFALLSLVLIAIIGIGLYVAFKSDGNEPSATPEIEEIEKLTAWDVFLQKINEEELSKETIHLQEAKDIRSLFIEWGIPSSDAGALMQYLNKEKLNKLGYGDKAVIYKTSDHLEQIQGIKLNLIDQKTYFYFISFEETGVNVHRIQRELEVRERRVEVMIDSVLWAAVWNNRLHFSIIDKMEDALKWNVDFHHLNPGDKFTALIEEEYSEGNLVGVKSLKAIKFTHQNEDHYAYYYKGNYYDEHAFEMNNFFLKSPVKYGGSISSKYNLTRFHPVYKRIKPHLGTDFAAKQGTPIISTANGTVSIASFKKANGNYIKIRHDKTYETQYLHMEGFADGIQVGSSVKQGEVIGYVGATGAATGPHVCYRFWRNGEQIDPISAKVSKKKKMVREEIEEFFGLVEKRKL